MYIIDKGSFVDTDEITKIDYVHIDKKGRHSYTFQTNKGKIDFKEVTDSNEIKETLDFIVSEMESSNPSSMNEREKKEYISNIMFFISAAVDLGKNENPDEDEDSDDDRNYPFPR